MKKFFLIFLLFVSCDSTLTPGTISPKVTNHNVQLHVAILNEKGVKKYGNRAVHLQQGSELSDSAAIVGQLAYDNQMAQSGATPDYLMHDDHPYDSCFYSDAHGRFIVEVLVDITGLSDTTGKAVMIRRWCSNGYAPYTKTEWWTPMDILKTIFPNI